MVTPQQIHIIQDLVDDAVHRGARLLTGGKRNNALLSGLFYEPTVLADVTTDMRIAQEEVFGPVMSVFSFSTEEEAISIVNSCNFGLGSCVFTKNDAKGFQIGSQFNCGMMCVNDFATNYLVQSLPFGGVKHSGFGRFAGPEGLQALCLQKSIVVDKVPFIRTTIPTIMQFPIQPASLPFGCSLVSLIYGLSLKQRLSAIFGLIRPNKSP
jgi:acyl-CoA reductase-like NAD-dependent aldehyde dehydrogenase